MKKKQKGRFLKRRYRLANKARFVTATIMSAALIVAILIAALPSAAAQPTIVAVEALEIAEAPTAPEASVAEEKQRAEPVSHTTKPVRISETEQVALALESQRMEREIRLRLAELEQEQLLATSRGADSREEVIRILEHIVQAEAGGEPFQGKIAIVNVIMNRVKSDSFPNTIRGVVFQKWQFTPATTGKIWRVEVSEESKRAVREALKGQRATGEDGTLIADDVYFFLNPKLATDKTIINTQTLVTKIGDHNFYR